MTASFVFSIVSSIAMLSWIALLLAVFFKWNWLRDQVLGRFLPLAFALIYAALMTFFFAGSAGGFDSLSNVKLLFTSDWIVVAGWVHYLAFDLFMGSWISRKVAEAGLPRWLLLFLLPLTFMFGPVGYFAYEVCRFLFSTPKEVSA